jgi:succinate dehydrogenase hydrophobic anchor subunit
LQVVVEDYVPGETKRMATLLVIKGVIFLLTLTCLVSILKLGL